MKLLNILFAIAFVITAITSPAHAQQVQGKITINKQAEAELRLETPYTVNLFKTFKKGDNQLIFFFEGKGYDKKNDRSKPEFNFFAFKTTVKHNGRTIQTMEREPMPYIPGGMFLPAEAFDFVHILGTYRQEGMSYKENSGALPKGEYQIILEAKPVEVKGDVERGLIMFIVK